MRPSQVDFLADALYGLMLLIAIVLIAIVASDIGIAFGLGVLVAYAIHVGWKMGRFDPNWMTTEVAEQVEKTVTKTVEETVDKSLSQEAEQVAEQVGETVTEEVTATVEQNMAEAVERTVGEEMEKVTQPSTEQTENKNQ